MSLNSISKHFTSLCLLGVLAISTSGGQLKAQQSNDKTERTVGDAAEDHIAVAYKFADLVLGADKRQDFNTLMTAIQTEVAPESWEALGGPGTMFPYRQNSSLVINHTKKTHGAITELLDRRRKAEGIKDFDFEQLFIVGNETVVKSFIEGAFDLTVTGKPSEWSFNGSTTADLDKLKTTAMEAAGLNAHFCANTLRNWKSCRREFPTD